MNKKNLKKEWIPASSSSSSLSVEQPITPLRYARLSSLNREVNMNKLRGSFPPGQRCRTHTHAPGLRQVLRSCDTSRIVYVITGGVSPSLRLVGLPSPRWLYTLGCHNLNPLGTVTWLANEAELTPRKISWPLEEAWPDPWGIGFCKASKSDLTTKI